MTEDERAIRDLVDNWMRASERGDLDAVLRMMSDDVVFQTCGREPFGKEAFAATSQGMKGVQLKGAAEIKELKVLQRWAWGRSHVTVTMTPPDGKAVTRSGYTLTVFKKERDGRWVIARDANLMPPPSAG